MALVTLINGECRAGVTPQTVRYPMRPAKANVKKLPMKIGPVAFPSARASPIPPVTVATSREVFCHGVIARTSGAFVSCAGLTGRAGGGAGRGAVGTILPLYVTIEPRTTSSFRSIPKVFSSGAIERRNLVMLFE